MQCVELSLECAALTFTKACCDIDTCGHLFKVLISTGGDSLANQEAACNALLTGAAFTKSSAAVDLSKCSKLQGGSLLITSLL